MKKHLLIALFIFMPLMQAFCQREHIEGFEELFNIDTVNIEGIDYTITTSDDNDNVSIVRLSYTKMDELAYINDENTCTLPDNVKYDIWLYAQSLFLEYFTEPVRPRQNIIVGCLCDKSGKVVEMYFMYTNGDIMKQIPLEYFYQLDEYFKSSVVFKFPKSCKLPYCYGFTTIRLFRIR